MAEGKVVAEGDPHEVMQNPAVIDAYLGQHHDEDIGVDPDAETEHVSAIKELLDDER
jgi:branched-chain amino acid transport system ATP-binding protein